MNPRCPFCSAPFSGDYPHRTVGAHTVLCEQCRRAFLILVRKGWLGYQRETRVR